jgi:hypothetical protein
LVIITPLQGSDVQSANEYAGRGTALIAYARGMLFERRLRDGIEDGSITVAFRRWKREGPHLEVGGGEASCQMWRVAAPL